MNCWKCGCEIDTRERIGFREVCPRCDRALHACRNCDFWDIRYHNECRETQADLVADKERGNFCEFFAPRRAGSAESGHESAPSRHRLESLFRKKA